MTKLEQLYDQAEKDGIAVENFPLPTVAATAVFLDGRYYIGIDRSHFETTAEEAECLAHELGHCRTGTLYPVGERHRLRAEKRADEWAITAIIPKSRFFAALKSGCREIWEFADELGITCRFAEKVLRYYLQPAQ